MRIKNRGKKISEIPELLKEWNYEKNTDIRPEDVAAGTNRKIWWKCERGHEWQTSAKDRNKGYKCPYCSNRKILTGYNDISTINPGMLEIWDFAKNKDVDPYKTAAWSSKTVAFHCKKCGYEWNDTIQYRATKKNKCPQCEQENRHIQRTDFKTLIDTNPELLSEWDYEKNGALTPENINVNSIRYIWWKCEQGHSWKSRIKERLKGKGCPTCNHTENKRPVLAEERPDLINEWNYEKNGDLLPDTVYPGSDRKVWWKCSKCGYEYELRIKERCKKKHCPVCSGQVILPGYNDFATKHPDLMEEWDYEKNTVDPTTLSDRTNRHVWWKCKTCGQSWHTQLARRVDSHSQCPYCLGTIIKTGVNDIATVHPEILEYWDYKRNTKVDPTKTGYKSNIQVWWKCEKGHHFERRIDAQVEAKNKCPICYHEKKMKKENG